MNMIFDQPAPVAHFRLFFALSVMAHLLVFAWNVSSLMLPGRAEAPLSVTLEGSRSDAATPRTRVVAKQPRAASSRNYMVAESTEVSGPAAIPAVAATRESLQTAPEDGADRVATRAYLRSRLLANLENYFHYPSAARRNGWEGTVLLGLRVEPDGQLDGVRLERSSGYAVLDDSALNSLKRVGKLAEARAWLEGRSVDMQLPVIYRLIEN
jgi:protein TonB